MKYLGLFMLLVVLLLGWRVDARKKPAPKPVPPPQKVLPRPETGRKDTVIKGTTLEVYQQYEPELKPIQKPEFQPGLPPKPTTKAQQVYEVPQQNLYYSYRALPLRPLALGKDTTHPAHADYLLLGGGNLATVLAEFGIGSLHGSNWQTAFQGRYLTQEGNLEGQVYRTLLLKGTGTMVQGHQLLEADIQASRNVVGAYGYDHDQHQYAFTDIRRILTSGAVNFGFSDAVPNTLGIHYHPEVNVGYFAATTIDHEVRMNLSLPVSKQFDSNFSAGIGVNTWVAKTTLLKDSRNNSIIQVTPGIDFHRESFNAHLGLYPSFGAGNSYLLPDINASLKLKNSNAVLSISWKSTLIQNTAQQLYLANPYLAGDSSIYGLQTKSDAVIARLGLGLGKHLSVWAAGGWQHYMNLPLFVSKRGGDGKDFTIIYDPQVQAITWSGGIDYAVGRDLILGASGLWYNYYNKTYDYVWNAPLVHLKGHAIWRPIHNLSVTADLEFMDQMWGLNAAGNSQKLSGVVDLDAAAEYSFMQRLNIFIKVDNILNAKNERWLGYPSYGVNIYGGLRFLF